MRHVKLDLQVVMELRENETEEQASERLYTALYDGLCNNAEHVIDFEYKSEEFVEW